MSIGRVRGKVPLDGSVGASEQQFNSDVAPDIWPDHPAGDVCPQETAREGSSSQAVYRHSHSSQSAGS